MCYKPHQGPQARLVCHLEGTGIDLSEMATSHDPCVKASSMKTSEEVNFTVTSQAGPFTVIFSGRPENLSPSGESRRKVRTLCPGPHWGWGL